MEFRTELTVNQLRKPITHSDKVVTIGSCFADDMGNKLSENKFEVLANPFGTVYSPISIFQLLDYAIAGSIPRENGFVVRDEIFFHYDFHSSWFDTEKEALINRLKAQIDLVKQGLKNCSVLMITFGTAWCYKHIETNSIVANCHKIPANNFTKFLLTQRVILESFNIFFKKLKEFNPSIRIIFSVSPVRHVKDTLELNSVSKAILRLTAHTLAGNYPDVEYFPAYEIMMDDLRDYRFYQPDLIHPSDQAVDYIWDKFSGTYFNSDTRVFLEKWRGIQSALQHKPFHPQGASHQKFLRNLLSRLKEMQNVVNVNEEIQNVEKHLK